ncbi:hypothetical protein BD410DRAFT_793561 [Rickenella mellea]|uniref:BTB domain-containing protein n=1 Tax=Rickenella mellea TaxID=50990 RepID=A0A4Y7PUM9_9AGAM|nr:hypothetical protein BD410DRAFT_793561 [Rickenella mellea]
MNKATRERAKKGAEQAFKRDEKYYVQSLVFLVEDCLFKAPRPYFEQSEVFRDTFKLPPVDGVFEGANDETALRLHGIKANDFRAFLSVLMPLPSSEEATATKEEWLGVLSLADMWNFEKIRQLSIDKLRKEPMDAVERILHGRKHQIEEWLLAGHLHLARRDTFLSIVEAEQLGGLPFVIKMVKARDLVRVQHGSRAVGIILNCFGLGSNATYSDNSSPILTAFGNIVIIDDPSKADPDDEAGKVPAPRSAQKRPIESDSDDSDSD